MTTELRIHRDFDMSTQHLGAELDHITARAREDAEIARRKALPPGSIGAEQQELGIAIGSQVLDVLEEPDDIAFGVALLAPAAFNTAWYGGAKNAEVMRRRLKLPLFTTDTGERLLPSYFWESGRQQFRGAVALSATVTRETKQRSERLPRRKVMLMRQLGNASLALSCSQLGQEIVTASPYEAQQMARQESLRLLTSARTLGAVIGRHPSLAQLADGDSDLSVYWRRNAPNGARRALLDAAAALHATK